MTRYCHRYPDLVGPHHWLPPEPFEFGWTSPVGCNNLRCESCGEPVRAEVVLGDWEHRHYACACQQHDESGVYRIGGESDDIYPLELTEWACAGHPDLVLPATLDGIRLDTTTDWATLAADATLSPPFAPPRVELAWTTRLYRLLGGERVLLSRAVAGLLTAEDPRLVRGAYLFFFNEREAEGAERIAAHVAARQDWLRTVPNPDRPAYPMINYAAMLLHERLRIVDEAGEPVDRRALEVAKELALAGIGPSHTPLAFGNHDPDWLMTHAARLARTNNGWITALVHATDRLPAAQRDKVLREITEVAPEQARTAIQQHFRG